MKQLESWPLALPLLPQKEVERDEDVSPLGQALLRLSQVWLSNSLYLCILQGSIDCDFKSLQMSKPQFCGSFSVASVTS